MEAQEKKSQVQLAMDSLEATADCLAEAICQVKIRFASVISPPSPSETDHSEPSDSKPRLAVKIRQIECKYRESVSELQGMLDRCEL